MACSEGASLVCEQLCKAKKSCGNHKCEGVCCPGFGTRNHEVHLCLQVCGKPLRCGNHICEDFCHLGKCAPCRVVQMEPLWCACGAAKVDPPVLCGTAPPFCSVPCREEMECGHRCRALCHPGEHPLCCELVARTCVGGHCEMQNKPCHVGALSCGQPCGRDLPCRHSCKLQCHGGACPPCNQACGAPRVHCGHSCEAPCHPGSECADAPCRRKVRLSCACGMRLEERACGACSSNRRPEFAPLKCLASCERPAPPRAAGAPQGDPARYATDLFQLASQNVRYIQTLEDHLNRVPGSPGGVALPACDARRRQIAVEYARLHWRLKTSSRPEAGADGWWLVKLEAAQGARPPRPLLSEVLAMPSGEAQGHLVYALGVQPRLRFTGVKGDEAYDLVGLEGLLGVRPGDRGGEVLAFVDRSATGQKAVQRLTGQPPGPEPAPVVRQSATAWGGSGSAPASGLRVVLEQTLSSGASVRRPRAAGGASVFGSDGWDAETPQPAAEAAEAAEDVPDNWEDDEEESP